MWSGFRTPEQTVVVEDDVLGTVTTPAEKLDDFVIRKADGYPTYHFAVVVDDELMRVTHVLRGQEHLNNTAKHVLLQDALGFRRPTYGHISLIFNPDGTKMSKRDKDKALRREIRERGVDHASAIGSERWAWWLESKDHQLGLDEASALADEIGISLPEINVDDFRRSGYLPEVLVNYLALLGWSPGGDVEQFDRAFLLERFDLDRVVKSPAKFDRDKLLSFNMDAIQAMDSGEFVRRYCDHCAAYHPEFEQALGRERLEMLARANQPRSKTLEDQIESSRFFIESDDAITPAETKAVRKALGGGPPSGLDHLEAVGAILEDLGDWTLESLESSLDAYSTDHAGGKLGKVAQPLRVAVSGSTVSPAIHETLLILGRESVLARIRRCIANRELSHGAGTG